MSRDIPILISTGHDNASNYEKIFSPAIELVPHAEYDIALTSAAIFYSWSNISATNGNNKMSYSNDDGLTWKAFVIPDGQYTFERLNVSFKEKMKAGGDYTVGTPEVYPINIGANTGTGRISIEIALHYRLDISSVQSKIYDLLGYDATTILLDGVNEGTKTPNVNWNITGIYIHCNLAAGGYLNGSSGSDIIYSFTPMVAPFQLLSINPNNLIFVPLNAGSRVDKINIRLTDQEGREVDPQQPAMYNFIIRKRDSTNSGVIEGISNALVASLEKMSKLTPIQ